MGYKIYSCPNCRKIMFQYGFCSDKCEKEFLGKLREENEDDL